MNRSRLVSRLTQEAIVNLVKELRKNAQITFFDKDGKPLPQEAVAEKPEAAAASSEASPPPAPEATPAEAK